MKQLTLEQKLFLNGFRPDRESHLRIIDQAKCRECKLRQCTYICPVNTYRWENDQITVFFEGCLECGACRIACQECKNLEWSYPRGGFGVNYRTG
jgi:ferredoxin like protein